MSYSGLHRINLYSIQQVESLIGEDVRSWDGSGGRFQKTPEYEIELEGYRVYTRSMRYKTFMEKGYACVKCGRKGAYYALETSSDNVKRAHFNLYAEDGMLMTKDHIVPKSKGGKDTIDNFAPMCQECNSRKGNRIEVEL